MARNFNPLDDKDHRTLDAAENVIIITSSKKKDLPISDYYYGNNSVIHHQRIELPRHEYEPGSIYMRSNARYLTSPITREHYRCKPCGKDSMRPISGGIRNPSLIECECELCRMKMFIEIPYRRDTR